MPPIQVHIDDPITPKKAQDSNTNEQSAPYPAAQPGAPAVPAPTGYVPSPQAQPQPSRTTPTSNYGPPSPQPGAVPIPQSQQSNPLPPPPKAGETPQKQPPVTAMPPQMGVPPPQQNYTPTKGTIYSPAERTTGGPTTVNFGAVPAPAPAPVQHPLGYQQDLNAQEMSSAQRASLDTMERRETLGQGLGVGGNDGTNDTVGNAWNMVKGWATAAGNTLAETEKEVWKKINKE